MEERVQLVQEQHIMPNYPVFGPRELLLRRVLLNAQDNKSKKDGVAIEVAYCTTHILPYITLLYRVKQKLWK